MEVFMRPGRTQRSSSACQDVGKCVRMQGIARKELLPIQANVKRSLRMIRIAGDIQRYHSVEGLVTSVGESGSYGRNRARYFMLSAMRQGMLRNCVFGTYRAPATNAIIRLRAIGHLQQLSKTVQ